ncbi:MAG TPA: ribosomal protein S18-alanine N-acetyltransferase [Pyrinomonadaceae bacterium]|jgi:ribosomal-protein-alanine N-acetyltransferase
MSRAQQTALIDFDEYVIEWMTEHDLIEVVEIEETSGLSLWGWEAYRAELDRRESVMLVARRAGAAYGFEKRRVEGFIAARLVGEELHINNIGVRAGSRQRGLGSSLLSTALRWGAREGALAAALEVRSANRAAQSLYRRHGFEVVGRRKSYYRQPTDDALVMSVRLRPEP